MRNVAPADPGVSAPEPASSAHSGLEVVVVHTSVQQTLAALRAAGSLAAGLGARIQMVVPQVVPFPAPLDQPLVDARLSERKFRTIAEESSVETRVDICLCREWRDGVLHCLKPRSTVVLGTARHWWQSQRERRLARTLRQRGHQVILAKCGAAATFGGADA
jgi:hypothetical protein